MGKFIACLLFIICGIVPAVHLTAQEETRQVIKDWQYDHYEKETLIWQAKGKEAVINKREYQLKNLVITYYLGLEEGVSSPTNRFLVLSADDGVISQDNNSAVFKNNIYMEMPGNPDSSLNDTWKVRATSLGIKCLNAKDKAPREISVGSADPITLTQDSGITLTANGFKGTIIDASPKPASTTAQTEFRKVIFNKAALIRIPTPDASTNTNKTLLLKADIMELCDPALQESVIVLKGKKYVLLSDSVPVSITDTSSLWITSEGDIFIYPHFYKIKFQNKVRAIQSTAPFDADNVSGKDEPARPGTDTNTANTSSKGILKSDSLTLFLNPENNVITNVRAEGNVILNNQDNSVLSCETLDWLPEKQIITIKSHNEVKIWIKDEWVTGHKAIIHTSASGSLTIGAWKDIEFDKGIFSIPKDKGK